MGRLVSDDVLAILSDPYETLTRMDVKHREGPTIQFTSDLWTPEQAMLVDDWWDAENKCLKWRETTVAKGRNQGVGEITQKFMTWFARQSPDVIDIGLLAHTEPARDFHINRYFENGSQLPPGLRPETKHKVNEHWEWAPPPGRTKGTKFIGVTQGGKTGKGQSLNLQMLHATECGMYTPAEDAATTIGSLTATMHESSPYYFFVKESTSSGPGTWWQAEVQKAERDAASAHPQGNFRFFPWSINPSFVRPFRTDAERRDFQASLTPDEMEARKLHDQYLVNLGKTHPHNLRWVARRYPQLLELSLEALAWRRRKIDDKYSGIKYLFAHDYPITVAEAFLSGGAGWFDPDVLSAMRYAAYRGERSREGVEVWRRPEANCRYAVGVDVAEGTGGDYSVICVLDHLLRQCAVWSDNRTPPEQLGELAVRVAATYNGAVLLIEANKRGTEAIKAARALNYQNFYMEKSVTGTMKDWITKGNQFASNKEMLYGHARTQMNKKRVEIRDPLTIDELTSIGVDSKGSIGGRDKKHDDRAMAWVLALWAAKRVETWQHDVHQEIEEAYGLTMPERPRPVLPFARHNL